MEFTLEIKHNKESGGVSVYCEELDLITSGLKLHAALREFTIGLRDLSNSFNNVLPIFLTKEGQKIQKKLEVMYDSFTD